MGKDEATHIAAKTILNVSPVSYWMDCLINTDLKYSVIKKKLRHTYIAKDSPKIKKKTKIPRVTDEGWNSQKQLPSPVEKKRNKGRKILDPHSKLSLGVVLYKPTLK